MNSRRRMLLYRTMHSWHWISAAICLAGLLLFCITGITLNHASAIAANPQVIKKATTLPDSLRAALSNGKGGDALPDALADWIEDQFDIDTDGAEVEWSPEELYVSAPGPGRDAWVMFDRASYQASSEVTDRGWIAYFNDLHKGRNTGLVWRIFIDVVAAAVLFFSLTGLVLLQIQARQRRSTWPLVIGGTALALILMIFFIH